MTDVIPFADWLPDLPEFANPGCTDVNNVLPAPTSYRPLPSLSDYVTSTTTATPTGAAAGADVSGFSYVFAGDATKLYRLDSSTMAWGDVSRASPYSTADGERWRFTLFGNDMVASNFSDNPQIYTLNTSTAFANLTTGVKFKFSCAVRDFLFVGYTQDAADGVRPNRVRWSAIGDPTNWTNVSDDPTTQSDWQDLYSGGAVMGTVGGEYGIVLQERSIRRFTYTGNSLIFQNDEVEQGRGCLVSGSIVNLGPVVFYLSEDGWYATDGNGPPRPIGANKINKWFFSNANTAELEAMTATIDPYNSLVMWSFAGVGSSTPNKLLIYDYVNDKWSKGDASIALLARLMSVGQTLESLDNIAVSLDALTTPLDSRAFVGGKSLLSALTATGTLQTFTGSPLPATLETTETALNPSGVAMVTGAAPLVDGGTLSVSVAGRQRLNDSYTFGAPVTQNASGICPLRNTSRYHRFRVNISGDWTHAQGVAPIAKAGGGR